MLAADHFSTTSTGALIIIEREIGLRTFIESGVPLDANLSYDLLITIFRPSAPLHDSAVMLPKGTHRCCRLALAAIDESGAVDAIRHPPSRSHRHHRRD